MIIQVASNLQGEIGSREVLHLQGEPASFMQPDDPQITEPISGKITITRDPEGLAVRGTIQAVVRLTCDRDLTEFDQAIQAPIEALYTIGDNVDSYKINGVEIDLDPALRESVLLALPVHPLCKADCTVPLEY